MNPAKAVSLWDGEMVSKGSLAAAADGKLIGMPQTFSSLHHTDGATRLIQLKADQDSSPNWAESSTALHGVAHGALPPVSSMV